MKAKKFDLFMGCLGNGITVCNAAVMESGDYKQIAHISEEGNIKWYVKPDYCPADDRRKIEQTAAEQKAQFERWFSSLSPARQYEYKLDHMTIAELVEHLKAKQA